MVTRVSTVGNYSSVLANLMAAQQRQNEAGDQVATQKQGTDLKDYARHAEMLTSMRSVQTRLDVYSEQNKMISDKLATQDMALNQIGDAIAGVRQAISDALASGRADTLMQDLDANMRNAVEGMNARYAGKYLFAGGQIDTKPVTATTLTDLTSGPPISSFFKNDQFQTQAKVDDSTTVTTGMLADDLGTDMLTKLQTIEAFHESGSGPLTGQLTQAQVTFLQGELAGWDQAYSDITTKTGRNGLVQQRVDTVKQDLVSRSNTLIGMIGDVTDADMAKAAVQLQQAQMSVQAAAQVFLSLQNTSLLNILQ
jgi:flagellar hook-associated protein 3 FlgL